MRKAYHLSTCSTCQKILAQIPQINSFELQDIKTNKLSLADVEEMRDLAGSYEAIFSRRAMKFRSLGLNTQELKEEDYKKWILEEYTFLKRPVFIVDGEIFVGNSKKTVDALLEKLSS